ncbi:MAG: YitT family protein [Oscillospiraceae bacterium]|nr:YitT family protein [Oscillospiraceae bacterium]MDY3064553.1 YitT family protein [Oscillospiraceae bacterium]
MKEKLKTFAMMTIGVVLTTIGVYFFKIPNGFSTGGVSGISTVLGNVIPFISPAQLISVINMLLLVLGFIVLGKGTGAKTTYCSILFSVLTWLLEKAVPLSAPLTDEPFLELVYAILLTAIGAAILFNAEASSGGTDIIALILKKYTSLDVGKALLCTDFIIAASSFFVFGIRTGLFSLLGLFAKAFLVDNVIESLNVCKYFMIITERPDPIVDYILHTMGHSATTIDALGEYSHTDKKMIVTLCRRIEAAALKRKLKELDPSAFVIVNSTSEIIGRGFRSI